MVNPHVSRPHRISESSVAKSKQGRVNYQELGKLALRDEVKKLLNHPDPIICLIATMLLKVDC